MPNTLINGAHIDTPLSNFALKAFQSSEDFVAQRVFPVFDVVKESDLYYKVDPNSWLLAPVTDRARKTAPNVGEWKVDSEGYRCRNFAWSTSIAKEDLANADAALQLRENSAMYVTETLLRGLEIRVANQVTSISNVGSGVALTGTAKWGDYAGSDPISDVTTAHAFIRSRTGIVPNTMVVDYDTYQVARFHPLIRDFSKMQSSGPVPDSVLRDVFRVDNILIGRGIKNNALENATASLTNIWGNNALLCYVQRPTGLRTATFGLSFRWTPEGLPAPMVVQRADDPDPKIGAEWIWGSYYQDEKVVARDLAYLISGTL